MFLWFDSKKYVLFEKEQIILEKPYSEQLSDEEIADLVNF